MHDLLAAKEIIDEVIGNANKNSLNTVNKVVIELGQKKYAHGDHEHIEEIDPENLEFNLKLFAKNTVAETAEFVIKKSNNPDILVKEIEGK